MKFKSMNLGSAIRRALVVTIMSIVISTAMALPTGAIYGGSPADIGAYPGMASIQVDRSHACGGVLVRPNAVLTAAHCVAGQAETALSVFIGKDRNEWSEGNRRFVSKVFVHPQYRVGKPLANDIAVVVLARSVDTPTVPLATAEPTGSTVLLVWGCVSDPTGENNRTCSGGNSTGLLSGTLRPTTDARCGSALPDTYYPESQFCLYGNRVAGHYGDSGGPALVATANGWSVAGVLTQKAVNGFMNGFTSVPALRGWIDSALTSARRTVTSFDRMRPGVPLSGQFTSAWQGFVSSSNTLSYIGILVGNSSLPAGVRVPFNITIRLCTDPACTQILAQARPEITNFGNTWVDVDVPVVVGRTYFVVWYQPQPANNRAWITYWWAGGTTIATSDQMAAVVLGYNR